jgi:hypothetical protein
MKIQKQITVTEYKGYQLRHSSETGHVGVYDLRHASKPCNRPRPINRHGFATTRKQVRL